MKTFLPIFITFIFLSIIVSLIPSWFGRTIKMISPPQQNDVLFLNPEEKQSLYGILLGYPHMYEFSTIHPMRLELSLLVPDHPLARNNISGIVLRVNENGSVSEIARLQAKEAGWESSYEPFGGDRYRAGSSFGADLTPGLYRIEVSTPDNVGKYVLKVGTKKETEIGYFTLLREFADVKMFFEVSSYRVLLAPVVLGPLFASLAVYGTLFFMWRWRRRVSQKSATL